MLTNPMAVAFVASAFIFSGCSDAAGVPDGLKKSTEAWIEKVKQSRNQAYSCEDGCREFRVSCAKKIPLDSADSPNGVTEKWLVGIQFAYFNKPYEKFYETSRLARFESTKSGWKIVQEYGVADAKGCTFF